MRIYIASGACSEGVRAGHVPTVYIRSHDERQLTKKICKIPLNFFIENDVGTEGAYL